MNKIIVLAAIPSVLTSTAGSIYLHIEQGFVTIYVVTIYVLTIYPTFGSDVSSA